jgi:SAM-dependent methyltransferase
MADSADESRVRKVQDVFDDWARRGRATGMERSHGPTARRALSYLPLPDDGRYLDIGCGSGYTVRWAAERLPRGEAVGVDVSGEMIEVATSLARELPRLRFLHGAFPDIELESGSFDAIFSMEVFYYLPRMDAALAAVARLLKPGGRFACVVDYHLGNPASHDWPEELGVEMNLLDESGWREAFESAGLAVVEQTRIRLPADEASEEWKVRFGSLLTVGARESRQVER